MLSVPFQRQLYDYFCGPAAVAMLCAWAGVRVSQKRVARLAGTSASTGTSHAGIERALHAFGLESRTRRKATLHDINHALASKRPILINYLETKERVGHYAIVIGATPKHIILNDPWHGARYRLTRLNLKHHWHNQARTSYGWMLELAKTKQHRRSS